MMKKAVVIVENGCDGEDLVLSVEIIYYECGDHLFLSVL